MPGSVSDLGFPGAIYQRMPGVNKRILIVDDEEAISSSMGEYLADMGFDVVTCGSAEHGLALLERDTFHVAIVDLRLPGRSGDAFIIEVRRRYPDLRVLIHTGSMDYLVSQELADLGVSQRDVFFKPLPDLDILVQAIQAFF